MHTLYTTFGLSHVARSRPRLDRQTLALCGRRFRPEAQIQGLPPGGVTCLTCQEHADIT